MHTLHLHSCTRIHVHSCTHLHSCTHIHALIHHSTSARLEVFSLDLTSPGLEMPLVGAIESPQRWVYTCVHMWFQYRCLPFINSNTLTNQQTNTKTEKHINAVMLTLQVNTGGFRYVPSRSWATHSCPMPYSTVTVVTALQGYSKQSGTHSFGVSLTWLKDCTCSQCLMWAYLTVPPAFLTAAKTTCMTEREVSRSFLKYNSAVSESPSITSACCACVNSLTCSYKLYTSDSRTCMCLYGSSHHAMSTFACTYISKSWRCQ